MSSGLRQRQILRALQGLDGGLVLTCVGQSDYEQAAVRRAARSLQEQGRVVLSHEAVDGVRRLVAYSPDRDRSAPEASGFTVFDPGVPAGMVPGGVAETVARSGPIMTATEASEHGTSLDRLRASAFLVGKHLDSEATPTRDIAPLLKEYMRLSEKMGELEAQEQVKRVELRVVDGAWNPNDI